MRVRPDGAPRALLRNYSMSGPPGAASYRISVKRERDGVVSGYLDERVAAGDRLDVAAPRGTFTLDADGASPVLLVSAGIGATPVLAMLQVLAARRSERTIWWLHGARRGREHAFAREARTLLAALPHASARVFYSRPDAEDALGRDYDAPGRLDVAALAVLELPRDAKAYICGPAAFMDDLRAGLVAAGLAPSSVHTEPFGPAAAMTPGIAASAAPPPHAPPGPPGAGPTVQFARSDVAVPWSDDYPSLLDLAEACDVPVRWSCRTGVCHSCETTVIAGDADLAYAPDPVEPPAPGSTLICCARPGADLVLDL